jgi:flavorubredoxin
VSHFGLDLSFPALRQEPLEVAPDTFVIRAATPSVGGTSTSLNSMLIRAAQPVIVDTGMVTNRATWFQDIFSLVAPDAVRWVFISHNDSDHAGNLVEALERCPNAMVVTSQGESFRTAASFGIPFERMLMVGDGESFDVGDRALRAVRPPVYDSPYTRGLFDPVTRIYYASDAFCAPMPAEPVDRVDQIPAAMWSQGMAQFHHVSVCPWIAMVDPARFRAEVEKLAGLGIETIVGAHTPVITGAAVPQAFEQLASLPTTAPAAMSFAGLFG